MSGNHGRTYHHLCSILLVRSKLLGQPTSKEKGLQMYINTRTQGSPRPFWTQPAALHLASASQIGKTVSVASPSAVLCWFVRLFCFEGYLSLLRLL